MEETWAVTDIDYDDYLGARNHIDAELRKLLGSSPKPRGSKAVKALSVISARPAFDDLISNLATAAVLYKAGVVKATFDPNCAPHFNPVKRQSGRPSQPEVQALMFDVCEVLNAAIGMTVGIYQNDGDGAEGLPVELARILARSVGKPLSGDVRKQISKARKIKSTF